MTAIGHGNRSLEGARHHSAWCASRSHRHLKLATRMLREELLQNRSGREQLSTGLGALTAC